MTPEEFKEAMQAIATNKDTETAHKDADALLCAALMSLGYFQGVIIFEEMPKWYS